MDCISLESYNTPGHFFRQINGSLQFEAWTNDTAFEDSATFCLTDGLANAAAVSFTSFTDDTHYLRHQHGQLHLMPHDESATFEADSTFHIVSAVVTTTGDQFGAAAATCDFNGDGFADLAIGVPAEDVGTVQDAGSINVLYGTLSGLQAIRPADQSWHQDSSNINGYSEAGDRFGNALAAGDFNQDGFCDLAIGTPGEDVGSIGEAGSVTIIYGSTTGLQATSPADQTWNQNSTGVNGTAEIGDAFGSALAAGDFNHDGYLDLAIGIPGEDVGSISDSGTVSILYGSGSGLQVASPVDQVWHQNSSGVNGTAETGDHFGRALTVGDFNHDGYVDLAIGTPGEDIGAITDAGIVHVLYGSATGLQTSSPADQSWHQNSSGIYGSAEAGDTFGSSLASGDFNQDGYADLAIGVPGEDVGSIVDAGAVTLLYGSASGLQSSSPADQSWHQNSSGVYGTAEAGDALGQALATGDFNQDGYTDLAIGVPSEDLGAIQDAGSVNALYGSANGLQVTSPLDQNWSQSSSSVKGVAEDSDGFGQVLATGDFNQDGYADLVVGVPNEDIGTVQDGGSVHILYGTNNRLQATSPNDQTWDQNSANVEGIVE